MLTKFLTSNLEVGVLFLSVKFSLLKMAKNTSSSAFRKIDVDQYSENNFKEDETDSGGLVGPDENEVNSLMQKYPFYMLILLIYCLHSFINNFP